MKFALTRNKQVANWMNKGNKPVLYLLVIIIGAVVIMSLLDPKFFTARNLLNILNQQSTLGIATIGVSIAMISGCIDLTIGNLLACTAAIAALLLNAGVGVVWVVIITCLSGLAGGFLNGLIVVKTRIDTFIATLGLMSVYQGLALIIPGGNNIYLQGKLANFGTYRVGGQVPIPIFYFIIVALVAYFVMRYLKFGRRLYSIGGNPETAYLAGINLDRNKISAYAISGFLASFTSLIVISRIGQSQPAMGVAYPLEAIAAAVIGGVALSGGRGSIPGVFLGVILLGLIRNSLNILRVQSFYQYVMLGVVIVIAVTLSNIGSRKKT